MQINFVQQAKIQRIIDSCVTLEQINICIKWLSGLDYTRFKHEEKGYSSYSKNVLFAQAKAKRNLFDPPVPIILGQECGVKFEA